MKTLQNLKVGDSFSKYDSSGTTHFDILSVGQISNKFGFRDRLVKISSYRESYTGFSRTNIYEISGVCFMKMLK